MDRLSLLLLATLPIALAQLTPSTCSGQAIPQAQALLSQYPPLIPGVVATIPAADVEGRALFNAIMATNSPYLSIPPTTVNADGAPVLGDYNWHADDSCWWSYTQCTTPKHGLEPDIQRCNSPSTWGLSIDDGPTCAHGPTYDFLQRQNPPQLASVYYIGVNVLTHPEEAQRGYNQGFEICAHTWSHHALTTLTNEQLFAELYYTKKAIKDVTGVSTRCSRPPYGDVNDRVRFFTNALDQRTHLWSADTDDFRVTTLGADAVRANYANIINSHSHDNQGIIVLNHETNDAVVGLFVEQFPRVFSSFSHVMPVSSCSNNTRIYGEPQTPDYPTFAQYASGQRPAVYRSNPYSGQPVIYQGRGIAAQMHNTTSPSSSSAVRSSTSSMASSSSTSTRSSSNLPTRSAEAQSNANVASQSSDASTISASLLLPTILLGFSFSLFGF